MDLRKSGYPQEHPKVSHASSVSPALAKPMPRSRDVRRAGKAKQRAKIQEQEKIIQGLQATIQDLERRLQEAQGSPDTPSDQLRCGHLSVEKDFTAPVPPASGPTASHASPVLFDLFEDDTASSSGSWQDSWDEASCEEGEQWHEVPAVASEARAMEDVISTSAAISACPSEKGVQWLFPPVASEVHGIPDVIRTSAAISARPSEKGVQWLCSTSGPCMGKGKGARISACEKGVQTFITQQDATQWTMASIPVARQATPAQWQQGFCDLFHEKGLPADTQNHQLQLCDCAGEMGVQWQEDPLQSDLRVKGQTSSSDDYQLHCGHLGVKDGVISCSEASSACAKDSDEDVQWQRGVCDAASSACERKGLDELVHEVCASGEVDVPASTARRNQLQCGHQLTEKGFCASSGADVDGQWQHDSCDLYHEKGLPSDTQGHQLQLCDPAGEMGVQWHEGPLQIELRDKGQTSSSDDHQLQCGHLGVKDDFISGSDAFSACVNGSNADVINPSAAISACGSGVQWHPPAQHVDEPLRRDEKGEESEGTADGAKSLAPACTEVARRKSLGQTCELGKFEPSALHSASSATMRPSQHDESSVASFDVDQSMSSATVQPSRRVEKGFEVDGFPDSEFEQGEQWRALIPDYSARNAEIDSMLAVLGAAMDQLSASAASIYARHLDEHRSL